MLKSAVNHWHVFCYHYYNNVTKLEFFYGCAQFQYCCETLPTVYIPLYLNLTSQPTQLSLQNFRQ